jgi:hypothetical protein
MARDITLGPGSQKLPTGNRHEIMLPPEVWPPLADRLDDLWSVNRLGADQAIDALSSRALEHAGCL